MGIKGILIEWAKGHFANGKKSTLIKTQSILIFENHCNHYKQRFLHQQMRGLYRNKKLVKEMKTKTGTNQSLTLLPSGPDHLLEQLQSLG